MPPPVPGGWIVGPPDFVGVGAQRAGTKWWYRLVCAHPSVQPATGKELHFFDAYAGRQFGASDRSAYHRLFPRPAGSLTGEWTPRYMHDFWTAPLLARAAPQARILVLLRDPWERYRSGLVHEARVLTRELRRRRDYVWAMIAGDALRRSLYAEQLERLLAHFDRSRLLVLQYERCVEDPAGELRRTYEFLGLDPHHRVADITARTGRSSPRTELAEHLRQSAREAMARDADRLARLVPDLDLALWPSCREI